MNEQEILYTMALMQLPGLGIVSQRILLDAMGSATAIYENRNHIREALPKAGKRISDALQQMEDYLPRAEKELTFCKDKHIACLHINGEDYPNRLRSCPDAPLLLFYRGSASLNTAHVISLVGTRKITEYGKELCREFVRELKKHCPNTLIVSGLAYGVDIHCHRAALEEGMDTVGVLAHGLDQIYPRLHRDVAVKMMGQGGLLTEFMTETNADKKNFVQRNRIVAGISDATIVVESAIKGGSLITADIAGEYNRDVFAFPGRTRDKYSEGCNSLIRNNKAALITCAEEFVEAMQWETTVQRSKSLSEGIQQELFLDLTEEEQKIVKGLEGSDGKQINVIAIDTGIPIGLLSSMLFSLEMKGVVKMLGGGKYKLTRG